MDYRIVERGEFYIMGKIGHIPLIYHGGNPHTANVWKQLKQEDLLVLMEYSEVDPKGIVTVHGGTNKDVYTVQEGDEILYCVGVVMEEPMPDRFKGRFDVLPYEASTWLVFPAVDNIVNEQDHSYMSTKQIYARITEWVPTSEYQGTDAPIITWSESFDYSKPDKKSEIWVPVRKRD